MSLREAERLAEERLRPLELEASFQRSELLVATTLLSRLKRRRAH
jgi:hypothetical protein